MKKQKLLVFQTTVPDPASPPWITRCVKASSLALCAQRPCAVPRWDGHGVTPVRCAQPSLIPAEEGSYQTTALEPAKVKSGPSEFLLLFLASLPVAVPPLSLLVQSPASVFSVLTPCVSVVWLHHPLISTHHPISGELLLIGLNWGGWQCLPLVCGMPADTCCGGTVRVSNTGQRQCHVGAHISGKGGPRPVCSRPNNIRTSAGEAELSQNPEEHAVLCRRPLLSDSWKNSPPKELNLFH